LRKKEEYLAKTPRLMQANKNNDAGIGISPILKRFDKSGQRG
jgi:hypothetical protein